MDAFYAEGSFFIALAFTSESRRGNPTGIVFAHPEWTDASCQRIAAELGYPDTAFLTPRGEDWQVRFFSPSEQLALCVQALIACGAVLVRRQGEVRLLTPAGEVTVRGDGERFWAMFPKERAQEAAGKVSLDRLELALPGRSPPDVMDSGRVRLFCEVPDVSALEGISLPAAEVVAACRRTGLQGLCFWTRTGADSVAMRVFTPSQDGGEDASTGGAVLGISRLLGQGTFRIDQGVGPFHRTGKLWLHAGDPLEVGGAVKVIGSGTLSEL